MGVFALSSQAEIVFEKAQWIAPPRVLQSDPLPIFRKQFLVGTPLQSATLRIIGLGDYDAFLNGKRVAATGINQPWSQYEKTLYYRDFDVTGLLNQGTNCLGVMLANSFWNNPNPPAGRYNKDGPQRKAEEPFLLCAELILRVRDGSIRRIGSDATWRTTGGPLTFSHIFAGEDYDARRESRGWGAAGFDDSAWSAPRMVPPPAAALEMQSWPGFAEMERFTPVAIKEPAPGVFIYLFPQNCSAQLRFEITGGKSGERVSFRCGEHKNKSDRLFGAYIVGTEFVTDGQPHTRQWISFYLGMQYVEVTGAVPEGRPNPADLPVLRKLELVHVRTALPEAGTFRSSSDLFNRTHQLIDWAMRANMSHVLTDCPHREKLGWLECAYLLAPSFQYRYDCQGWFRKIARDIRDAQDPSGKVRTVAPSYPAGRFPGAFDYTLEWGAAAVMLPWHNYEWSGDPAILQESYDSMKAFVDFAGGQAKDDLAPGGGLGDWYDYGHGHPPGPSRFTPVDLTATATWALCVRTLSRAAEVLQKPSEASTYRDLHARIAAAFQKRFVDPETGQLRHTGSPQCANAMALYAGVVPPSSRDALVKGIIQDLEKRGWQQTPGDVGHVYFIRALAEAGRSDVLHRVYSRQTNGSYGGILAKGLTSMPETWDAMMDGYQSLNHCMLGHVIEWYYGYVAGIRQAPGSVGWKNVLIAPNPGALTSADGSVWTPQGKISCKWRAEASGFHLEAGVPPGVKAEAILPSGKRYPLTSGQNMLKDR